MGIFDRFRKPAPVAPSPNPVVARNDAWVNPATGVGSLRDKSAIGFFLPDQPLTDSELSALYYHDDLAARIIDERVDQAFRKGYRLEGLDQDKLDELYEEAERIEVDRRFKEAWRWGRLYGSSILIVGALDGQMPTAPMGENVRSLAFLNPVDKRTLRIYSRYANPLLPQYGEPNLYQINPEPVTAIDMTGTSSAGQETWNGYLIHESRTIRFDGIETDLQESQKLGGWSYSVLQRAYKVLRQFGLSFGSAAILIEEASQGVFKIDGLISMLAGNERDALLERMTLVDMSKGAARSILVDAENEDYTRIPVQFAGLPDMLDRIMQRLAAATGMPVTLLMGQSPAGMNATGESDFRQWYDSIASEQEKVLGPRLLKLYKLIGQGLGIDTEGLEVAWEPLEEESPKDKATLYSTVAAADVAYVNAGVFQPQEIAIARAGQGAYDPFAVPAIDVAKLEAELAEPPPEQFTDPTDPEANAQTGQEDPSQSQNPIEENSASDT